MYDALLAGSVIAFDMALALRAAGGDLIRTDARGRVLADNGSIVAAGAVIDITEERRLEEHDRMLAEATHALASTTEPGSSRWSVAMNTRPSRSLACTSSCHKRYLSANTTRI